MRTGTPRAEGAEKGGIDTQKTRRRAVTSRGFMVRAVTVAASGCAVLLVSPAVAAAGPSMPVVSPRGVSGMAIAPIKGLRLIPGPEGGAAPSPSTPVAKALSPNVIGSQLAELTASDGAADDSFGYSVAVSGKTAVVGAPYHQVGSNADEGAAYVFAA